MCNVLDIGRHKHLHCLATASNSGLLSAMRLFDRLSVRQILVCLVVVDHLRPWSGQVHVSSGPASFTLLVRQLYV